MGPEERGTPTVVSERRQRGQRVEIAENGAVIGFQTPETCNHRPRNARFRLDPVEDRSVFGEPSAAFLQTIGVDHAGRELTPVLGEDALRPVALEDAAVDAHFRDRGLDCGRRHAPGERFGFHALDKGGEIAAAGRRGLAGLRGSGGFLSQKRSGNQQHRHARTDQSFDPAGARPRCRVLSAWTPSGRSRADADHPFRSQHRICSLRRLGGGEARLGTRQDRHRATA